jgi:hypothetical protein
MAVDVAQLERDGDLRGLVRVLEDTSVDCAIKAKAAEALSNLVFADDVIAAAVVAAGAIPPFPPPSNVVPGTSYASIC